MNADDHPLPEFGEYASESEWASAVKRSGADLPEIPSALNASVTPAKTPQHPQPGALGGRTATSMADRFASIFLLSFGLVYIVGGAAGYLALADTLQTLFTQLNIGDYTPTDLTSVFGILILASQAVVWIVTAVWSFTRLRQGRLTFWVPLVGGIVILLVSAVLFGVLLATDPAFVSFASTM